MPLYYFNVKDQQGIVVDPVGENLSDDSTAVDHARHVARELMAHRETRTRSWRMQICDSDRKPLSEVLFATVDNSIKDLEPNLREAVERTCARFAALQETIGDVRTTLHQIKGTMARAQGAPYLAAIDGKKI